MDEGGLEESEMPHEGEALDVAYCEQDSHCSPSVSPPGYKPYGCS